MGTVVRSQGTGPSLSGLSHRRTEAVCADPQGAGTMPTPSQPPLGNGQPHSVTIANLPQSPWARLSPAQRSVPLPSGPGEGERQPGGPSSHSAEGVEIEREEGLDRERKGERPEGGPSSQCAEDKGAEDTAEGPTPTGPMAAALGGAGPGPPGVSPEALMIFGMSAFLPPNTVDQQARREVGSALLHASGGSAWFSSQPLATAGTKPAFRAIFLAVSLAAGVTALQAGQLFLKNREQLVHLPLGALVRVNVLELRGSASHPELAAHPAAHAGIAKWGLLHNGCRVTRTYWQLADAPTMATPPPAGHSPRAGEAAWDAPRAPAPKSAEVSGEAPRVPAPRAADAHRDCVAPSAAAETPPPAGEAPHPAASVDAPAELMDRIGLMHRMDRKLAVNGFYLTMASGAGAETHPVRWLVQYSADNGATWHPLCASLLFRNIHGILLSLPHAWYSPAGFFGPDRRGTGEPYGVEQDLRIEALWAVQFVLCQTLMALNYLHLALCHSFGGLQRAQVVDVCTWLIFGLMNTLSCAVYLAWGQWRLGMVSLSRVMPFIVYVACEARDGTKVVRTIFLVSFLFECVFVMNQAVWLCRSWRTVLDFKLHIFPLIGLAVSSAASGLFSFALRRARRVIAKDCADYEAIWARLLQHPDTHRELSRLPRWG